jgi:hypothetical protein
MFRCLACAAVAAGALALPATAAADSGRAELTFDSTLLRARVSIGPVAPATRAGAATSLPVRSLSPTAVRLGGGLALRSGRHRVRVTDVQLTPSTTTWSLRGRVGGKARTTLMTLVPSAASPAVVSSTAARVSGATLRLTRTGARLLTRALHPRRALRATRIGTATVEAQTAAAGTRQITGGTVVWGYDTALRNVFQSAFTPLTTGGVTQGADGLFVLPVTGGTWDPATHTATITTAGSFRVGYQIAPTGTTAHGIWVGLADTRIDLSGAVGQISATSDSGYHDTPPVLPAARTIATLAPGAPTTDATTLTWTAIPAAIAPGGQELVQHFHDTPGRPSLGDVRQIDPVTISVQLG